jgi:glycosyltransferase domain-containing protein
MNNLTIIIPTHNRHSYLERIEKYYSFFPCQIYVIDSSVNSYSGFKSLNFQYVHQPKMSFVPKVLHALKMVETKYVILCADDDFLSSKGLKSAVSFLDNNIDYSKFVGNFIYFRKAFDGYFFKYARFREFDVIVNDLRQYWENYENSLWCLYRKEVLLKAFSFLNAIKQSNDNFIEFVLSATAKGEGKVYVSKEVINFRELNPGAHWGNKTLPLSWHWFDSVTKADYKKTIEVLDSQYSKGFTSSFFKIYLRLHSVNIFVRIYKFGIKSIRKLYNAQSDNFLISLSKTDKQNNLLDLQMIRDILER